jgi:hypothetical protein
VPVQLSHHGRQLNHSGACTVQACISDYMTMLQEYRRLQRSLGSKAVAKARELCSALTDASSWRLGPNERKALMQQHAEEANVEPKAMSELVSIRRKLLYDLPHVRARMAAATASNQQLHQELRRPGRCRAWFPCTTINML